MHIDSHITQYAAHGFIALFGAVVHALQAHRKGNTKNLADFAILTFMSSFSGVMFALVALYLYPHELYLTAAIAGTGGFLGVEGMTIATNYIKTKLK